VPPGPPYPQVPPWGLVKEALSWPQTRWWQACIILKRMGQDGVYNIKKEGPPYTLRRCRREDRLPVYEVSAVKNACTYRWGICMLS